MCPSLLLLKPFFASENEDFSPIIDLIFTLTEESRSFKSPIEIFEMEKDEEFSVNLLQLNNAEAINRRKQSSINASESVKPPDAEIRLSDKVVIRLAGM